MSNPFEAAIHALQETIKDYGIMGVPEVCDSCRAALNVLEAAGKVDKAEALLVLGLLEQEWYDTSGEHGESPDPEANEIMRPRIAVIRSYLSALPDKVKK